MKRIFQLVILLLVFQVPCGIVRMVDLSRRNFYYVSPNGNDLNEGTSVVHPFKTLESLGRLKFKAGDKIFLKGGSEFKGSLRFDPQNAESGLEIRSYGEGKALINVPARKHGIIIENLGNLKIAQLKLVGSGIIGEDHNGITFINDLPQGHQLSQLEIDDVEVSRFGYLGVFIVSTETGSGYQGVTISRVIAHDNWHGGIEIDAKYPDIAHENLVISDSQTYHNPGIPGHQGWTGNGIVVSGVKGGRIEYNEAWENGSNCDSAPGGPLGIWVWNVDQFLIQFNKSHHNHTKNKQDGGGFDIDGGTTNTIVQYNYSAHNDGYGYMLCEFGSSRPYRNNIFRFNVSVRDGNPNEQGALRVYGPVDESSFEHNMAYSAKGKVGSTSSIHLEGWTGSNLAIKNNILYAAKGTPSIIANKSNGKNLQMKENIFAVYGKFLPVTWNQTTLVDWKRFRQQTGLEKNGTLVEHMDLPIELFAEVGKKTRLNQKDFIDLEAELTSRLRSAKPHLAEAY